VPLIVMLHGSGGIGILAVEKWRNLAKKEASLSPDRFERHAQLGIAADGPDYLHDLVERAEIKISINHVAFISLAIRRRHI